MKNTPSISLIFPAFNEEEYVEEVISKARESLESLTNNYEIIIVDDASTDKTPELAEKLTAEDNRIKVYHHKTNQKLGKTLRTGISAAQKDLILYSDIDLPFDFKEIKKMVRLMEKTGADAVSAFRLNRAKKKPKRVVYSLFYNLLIKILFRVNIKDVNCPFKLFKKSILKKIKLKSNGSFIDAELIIKSIKRGYKVRQMGIEYFPRTKGQSTLASPRVILGILKEIILLYKETIHGD